MYWCSDLILKADEQLGPEEHLTGIVEETIPQTDSMPSVDRAISCFNKHIYRRHFCQSVVSYALFPIAERSLRAVEVHAVPVSPCL